MVNDYDETWPEMTMATRSLLYALKDPKYLIIKLVIILLLSLHDVFTFLQEIPTCQQSSPMVEVLKQTRDRESSI